MKMRFIKRSKNGKTGVMPNSYSPSSTCPDACPHKGKGCYARFHHTGRVWTGLDNGDAGISWDAFLEEIRGLPEGQIWRYGVGGDLPGKGNRINDHKLRELVKANSGRRGFSYTHKPMTEANRRYVLDANLGGFTINLSSDNPVEADRKSDFEVGPVVMTMPANSGNWLKKTPAGRKIVPCPAITRGLTCSNCQLCTRVSRDSIIGFPAHGTGARMVEEVYKK